MVVMRKKNMKSIIVVFAGYIVLALVFLVFLQYETNERQEADRLARKETIENTFMVMSYGYVNENYGYGDLYEKAVYEYPLTKEVFETKDEWISHLTELNNRADIYDPKWTLTFYPVYAVGKQAGVGKILDI